MNCVCKFEGVSPKRQIIMRTHQNINFKIGKSVNWYAHFFMSHFGVQNNIYCRIKIKTTSHKQVVWSNNYLCYVVSYYYTK